MDALVTTNYRKPPFRRIKAYAFDPSLDWIVEIRFSNQLTLQVPWEDLKIGPVGDYLEVVDVDPASKSVYAPIDLNSPYLLAQDGLDPEDGNPQFHQQMVYAVAMLAINSFEFALGRPILWPDNLSDGQRRFVEKLRIYPHAFRGSNAYYSPSKKAILFGYFPVSLNSSGHNIPGGTVFTCLSHDIIVHEMSHAILDGLRPGWLDYSNSDSAALHEAFSDIVALLHHFTFPDVLRDQIVRTQGYLSGQSLLGQLAQQFGQATGSRGALRDALGSVDPSTGEWRQLTPDPGHILYTFEPHARGAILVAAVFDAFMTIYKMRVADLLRLVRSGGDTPDLEAQPDLVSRLASEASAVAAHVLHMCIRALDYCPPVDVNFSDYLRALITVDRDLTPRDEHRYRVALAESFRNWGIYPQEVRSLGSASMVWREFSDPENEFSDVLNALRAANHRYNEG